VTVWCGQAWASLLAQGNVPTVPTVLYMLAGEGDVEGAAVWRQITAAVEELQRERRQGEAVN